MAVFVGFEIAIELSFNAAITQSKGTFLRARIST